MLHNFTMCAQYIIGTDVLPEPILIHLRNCSVETLSLLIRAKCAYPGDSGAMVTGFQVIAQPTDFDELGKIYVGHTLECQTSAVVEVEQNGEFLVSVVPVLGETGIVNSSVEYIEVVVVEDLLRYMSVACSYALLYCWNCIFSYYFFMQAIVQQTLN